MPLPNAATALKDALSKHLEPMVGYGLWWAWLLCALNSPCLFFSEELYHAFSERMIICTLLSGAAISLAIMVAYRYRSRFLHEKPIIVGSALILTVVSFAVYYLSSSGGQALGIFSVVLGILAGIGLSTLCIIWGSSFFGNLEPLEACITTSFAFLFALFVSSLALEKGVVTIIIVALFPLGSAYLLLREIGFSRPSIRPYKREDGGSCVDKQWHGLPLPVDLILIILSFGIAFGSFRSATSVSMRSGYQEFYAMAIVCAIALLVIVAISLLQRSRVMLAFTVALPLITLGIFLLSLFESNNYAFAAATMKAGVRCVDIMAWVMVASVAQKTLYSPLCVFSCGRAMGCIGGFFGYEFGAFLSNNPQHILPALIFVLFVLLAVSMFSIARNSARSEKDTAFSSDVQAPSLSREANERQNTEWQNDAVDSIAERYQLTSREKDVLFLLANGRSVGVISDKLIIAKSTVATHVHNIYDKTGVHSRQELIDLLESYRLGERPSGESE